MPEAEINRRGGATKVRTIEIPGHPGEYAHVYVVRKPGKKGGHTVLGEVKEKKDA